MSLLSLLVAAEFDEAANLIKTHMSCRGLQQPASVWAIWRHLASAFPVCAFSKHPHKPSPVLTAGPLRLGVGAEGISRKVLNAISF